MVAEPPGARPAWVRLCVPGWDQSTGCRWGPTEVLGPPGVGPLPQVCLLASPFSRLEVRLGSWWRGQRFRVPAGPQPEGVLSCRCVPHCSSKTRRALWSATWPVSRTSRGGCWLSWTPGAGRALTSELSPGEPCGAQGGAGARERAISGAGQEVFTDIGQRGPFLIWAWSPSACPSTHFFPSLNKSFRSTCCVACIPPRSRAQALTGSPCGFPETACVHV